ncbi:MAG: hypothetical protein BroJett022_03990 [Actinomycetes bacterium]|nr:MAG: hypothetical protein BroJett022_03990 [Actinomycetes bacterium]
MMLRRILIIGGSGAVAAAALAVVQIRVGSLFGTGAELDAFFVGAALPSVLLAVGAGAIFNIVIPRLPEGPGGAAAAGRFAALAATSGALVTAAIALAAAPIVDVIAPGLDGDTAREAAAVLRIYAITIPPTCVAFVFSGFAYSIDRSYVSGASGTLYALAWLGLLFVPAFTESVERVAVAGVLATIVQVTSAFALAASPGAVPWPITRRLRISQAAMAAAATVLGATLLSRVGLLLDPLFGSLLEAGSVSQLTYASRIMLLAVFISGQGPAFALLVVGRRRDDGSDADARIGVVVPLLLSLGAAAVFAICGPGLAQLLLARGELTTADAREIGELMRIYAPSICVIALVWALEAILYASQRAREVLMRVLAGLLVNMVASAAFVALLGVDGRPIGVFVGMSAQLVLLLVLLGGDPRVTVLSEPRTRDYAFGLLVTTVAVTSIVYLACGALTSLSIAGVVAALVAALVVLVFVVRYGRNAVALRDADVGSRSR